MFVSHGLNENMVHLEVSGDVVMRKDEYTGAKWEYVAALGEEWDNFVRAVNDLDGLLRAEEELFNG